MESLIFGIQQFLFMGTDGLVGPGGANPGGTAPAAGDVVNQATEYVASGAQQAAEGGGGIALHWWIIGYAALFAGLYFLMIRPQRKREKKMKELQSGLKTGDNVVTNGGLFGRIADVGTDCFVVEMGIGGRTVKVPVLKSDVLGVRDPVLTPPPKEEAK